MSKCRSCNLRRIYEQFAKKEAARRNTVAQNTPKVEPVQVFEPIAEPEVIEAKSVKKVVKTTRKNKILGENKGVEEVKQGDSSSAE